MKLMGDDETVFLVVRSVTNEVLIKTNTLMSTLQALLCYEIRIIGVLGSGFVYL